MCVHVCVCVVVYVCAPDAASRAQCVYMYMFAPDAASRDMCCDVIPLTLIPGLTNIHNPDATSRVLCVPMWGDHVIEFLKTW